VLLIFLVGFSPVILGEVTHSPQTGRSYFPGFIGYLLMISYMTFQVDQNLEGNAWYIFWCFSIITTFIGAFITLKIFTHDVLPARMAPARLKQMLEKLGIDEFYTYNTPYNDSFVDALPEEIRSQYKVHYINSLIEVREGYVVIPGTSSKAFNMESQQCAIKNGDFKEDPILNALLESKAIREFAVASFKTFGTSRIWVHESEVASYRDLILKEISEEDRWRGFAWIIDCKGLQLRKDIVK